MAFSGITDSQVEQYNKDGYLVIEELFDSEEMRLLAYAALARHGGTKAAESLAALFGRVELDEATEILRRRGIVK